MPDILSGDDDEFVAQIEADLAGRPTKLTTLQARIEELEAERNAVVHDLDMEIDNRQAAETQLAAVRKAPIRRTGRRSIARSWPGGSRAGWRESRSSRSTCWLARGRLGRDG